VFVTGIKHGTKKILSFLRSAEFHIRLLQHKFKEALLKLKLPCKREKYKSVAFFIISGLQLKSVNSSSSRVRDNLKSLHGEGKKKKEN